MINVGIIRYPGSNCNLETQRYFNFNNENKCFFIWHKETDFSLLDNVRFTCITWWICIW